MLQPVDSQNPERLCVMVATKDIAYFSFIMESYEGLCLVRCDHLKDGYVELWVPPGQMPEVKLLIAALGKELPITAIEQAG